MRETDRERIADAWIVVVASAAPGDTLGTISCYSPNQWCWVRRWEPVPAVFGRIGIASPGEKREGDGRMPSRLFTMTDCFGYGDTPVTS